MWTALSNRGTQSCSGANECDDKLTWYPSTTDTIGSTVASFFGSVEGLSDKAYMILSDGNALPSDGGDGGDVVCMCAATATATPAPPASTYTINTHRRAELLRKLSKYFPTATNCPNNRRFAYNNGQLCCQSQNNCGGTSFSYSGTCCLNNDFEGCPTSNPCIDYGASELTRIRLIAVRIFGERIL